MVQTPNARRVRAHSDQTATRIADEPNRADRDRRNAARERRPAEGWTQPDTAPNQKRAAGSDRKSDRAIEARKAIEAKGEETKARTPDGPPARHPEKHSRKDNASRYRNQRQDKKHSHTRSKRRASSRRCDSLPQWDRHIQAALSSIRPCTERRVDLLGAKLYRWVGRVAVLGGPRRCHDDGVP